MKRRLLIFAALLVAVSFPVHEIMAQRGGRGGGSRPAVNRSPSMSRPSVPSRPSPSTRPSSPSVSRPTAPTRPSSPSVSRPSAPSRPTTGQLPTTRPGGSARPSTPSAGTRPSIDRDKIQSGIGAGGGTRPAMPDWFKPGASQLPSTRPAPPTAGQLPARPGDGTPTRPGKPPVAEQPIARPPVSKPPVATPPIAERPRDSPPADRPTAGSTAVTRPPVTRPPGVRPPVRPPVVVHPPVGRPIHPWYPGHPSHPNYRPGHWWKWATAGAITGWVVHRWTQPIYYRYGSGGTVYYENNVVYVNGQEYGSPEKYYDDTTQIAASVPELTEEQEQQMEWMPLGVFALTCRRCQCQQHVSAVGRQQGRRDRGHVLQRIDRHDPSGRRHGR